MKRVLVVLAVMVLLTGCGVEPASTRAADRLRVTVVLPHEDQVYWSMIEQGALDCAEELGVDVKIAIPQLNYNMDQMKELILQAGAARVDVVIAQGADDEGYLNALRTVESNGTRVILIDTDAELENRIYVGSDNLAIGRQIGAALIKERNAKAQIAVLSGAPGFHSLELRLQGLEESLEDTPGMHIACVEYDQFDSLTVLERYAYILGRYPDVDTLVCLEGTGGYVLSRQLTEPPLIEHIYALDTSADALEATRTGLFSGVFVQKPYEMGRVAVELASKACGGHIETTERYIGVDFFSTKQLQEANDGA